MNVTMKTTDMGTGIISLFGPQLSSEKVTVVRNIMNSEDATQASAFMNYNENLSEIVIRVFRVSGAQPLLDRLKAVFS